MGEWLQELSKWLQQAWVYIPAILSFITAVGLPSLVQVAKIFTSAKLYLTKVNVLLGKLNQVIKLYNVLAEQFKQVKELVAYDIEEEIKFDRSLMSKTVNVNIKKIYQDRIDLLNARLEKINATGDIGKLDEITEEELNKALKSVKVKIKKE